MGFLHATSNLVFMLDFAVHLYKQLLHPRKSGPSLLVPPVREAEAGDFQFWVSCEWDSKKRLDFDHKEEEDDIENPRNTIF